MQVESAEVDLIREIRSSAMTDTPVTGVADVFRKRLRAGFSRDWVERIGLDVMVALRDEGMEDEGDAVAEALDFLVGWGPPGSEID
jgi:hypothetical protein